MEDNYLITRMPRSHLHVKLHSKNTRVKLDPDRVHWGQTPFRVNVTRKSVNLTRNMTQSWVNLTPSFCQVCGRLTGFPGHPWPGMEFGSRSLNKKEWICSLFKEWILEKNEIRVNLEWIWSEHLCYSLILEWTQGSLGIPEWSLWSLQNEWITQIFTPNSL